MSLVAPLDGRGRPAPVRTKRPGDRRSLSRSATRAIDVLEYFGEARRPLRAIEIGRRLELQPSTTNQLLKTMVDSAHLQFDARTMSYLPSPRLAGFCRWMADLYGRDERLRALVRDAQAQTGMLVTLTTPNDLFMQVIESAAPLDLEAERGQRISLFGSATGSAHLSTLSRTEIERLADRARIPPDQMHGIFASIAEIRAAGFAYGPSGEDVEHGIWSIALPLPGHALPFPMVLGLAGPGDSVRRDPGALYRSLSDAVRRWLGAGIVGAEQGLPG